jgi:IS5 family transposase
MQLVIDKKTKQVICVALGKGKVHDFKLLKNSKTHFAKEIKVGADKGYQGLKQRHENSCLPHKKPRGGALSDEQRSENRVQAKERIVVEHINRRFKVFRCLGERYRNRRKRFGLRVNLIAGLYNLDAGQ